MNINTDMQLSSCCCIMSDIFVNHLKMFVGFDIGISYLAYTKAVNDVASAYAFRRRGRNPQLVSYGLCFLLHVVKSTTLDLSCNCAPTEGQLTDSRTSDPSISCPEL